MGSYQEEIFIRTEKQFKNVEEMIGWLSSFKDKPGNAYEKDASLVAEDLQKTQELSGEAERLDQTDFTTADDLRDLRSNAEGLDTYLGTTRADTISIIQDKLNIVENLETKQIDLREQLISEREVLKQDLAEATTREEVKIASRELKELSPRSYGGLRSGMTRRTPKAFATLFQ